MFFYNSLLIISGFRFSDQEYAHSSVKCNTVTNVGKKLHREFYSLVFFVLTHYETVAKVNSLMIIALSGATHKDKRGIDECYIYNVSCHGLAVGC